MSPKEKAKQLFDEYYLKLTCFMEKSSTHARRNYSKQCALIAVNELIVSTQSKIHIHGEYYDFETTEYWIKVKQEIEKL